MLAILRKKKKAFLSSTSVDLVAWRNRVRETLVESGLSVLTMDDFPAMGKGAGQGSGDMVQRCNVLVGIYARRYGTLTADGRSVTEREYDVAREIGIPRICLMLKDDAEWPSELVEAGAGAAALVKFKEKVRSDVIVKEFSSLDDLLIASKAAADEYLQKEQRRRRIALMLLCLGVFIAVCVSVFAVLIAGTTAYIVPVTEPSSASADGNAVMAVGEDVFVTSDKNDEIYLWNAVDLKPRLFANANGGVRSLVFTPAGDALIGIVEANPTGSHLVCWAVPAGNTKWLLSYPEEQLNTLAVEPGGARIAAGLSDGSVRVLGKDGSGDKKYGVPHQAFGLSENDFGSVADLAFSTDGRSLAIAYRYGVFAILDLSTGNFSVVKIEGANYANALCFIGKDILVASGQPRDITRTLYKLWFYDRRTGQVESIDSDNIFWDLTPLDGGHYFLSANWNGEVALWDARKRSRVAAVRPRISAAENTLLTDIGYVPAAGLIIGQTDKKIFVWRLEWKTVGGIPVFWQRIL